VGTLSLVYERWLNGIPVGMLPQYYREYKADLDRLREELRAPTRPKGIECPSRRQSESAKQRCLKTKGAARYLGMSPWALRQEVNKGELHVVSSGEHTSSWKFDIRDLDAWVERHKITY
jgi:Helix-turn-helix domain